MSTVPPFQFGERLGLLFLVELSAVSAAAVSILLLYIAYSAITIRPGSIRTWKAESPVHLYFLNQLVCDLVQAVGGLMNIKWIVDAAVVEGDFCTAQGVVKQIGDVGTALSALSIATYTFTTLIFRWKPDTSIPRGVLVVLGIWIFLALIIGINVAVNGTKFYGVSGHWCWITEEFHVQRTVVDFMWMWISAFSSLLAYIPLFLVLHGVIVVDGWRVHLVKKAEIRQIPFSSRFAYNMLFYPTVYIITVLPLSVVRYLTFAGHNIPFSALVVTDGLFLSSGLLNVLLYAFTRPFLLPHRVTSHSFADFDQSEGHLPHVNEPGVMTLGRESPDQGKMFGGEGDQYPMHSQSPSFASSAALRSGKEAAQGSWERRQTSVFHAPSRLEACLPEATSVNVGCDRMGAQQSVPKITAQDRAILDMKLQRDKLKQYQKRIQYILDREHEIAKEHLAAGRKDRALIALRRRKYQEGLLAKTDGQLENLEQLVSTIEFSLVEVSVLHGLKQGNEVLKEIHAEMNIESVEKLLEETAEAREYQREIGDMLSNTLSLDDEDAVQEELKELQALATLNAQVQERPVEFPVAPTVEPTAPLPVAGRAEESAQEDPERDRIPVLA
ncbi:Snf7-domain-containing protein [Artomyces pyxidatus]|uniref:Snf7-domain-containing protein n=1 Tax=Artomyces pyxidatus TaxID=48021 RepID=A0ACB8THC7_9AGAM|nr:Snf7-domain-containing protein [Artomyces pyxidatus]